VCVIGDRAGVKRGQSVSNQARASGELGRISRSTKGAGTRVDAVLRLMPPTRNSHPATPDRFPTRNAGRPATTCSQASCTSHFGEHFKLSTDDEPRGVVNSIEEYGIVPEVLVDGPAGAGPVSIVVDNQHAARN